MNMDELQQQMSGKIAQILRSAINQQIVGDAQHPPQTPEADLMAMPEGSLFRQPLDPSPPQEPLHEQPRTAEPIAELQEPPRAMPPAGHPEQAGSGTVPAEIPMPGTHTPPTSAPEQPRQQEPAPLEVPDYSQQTEPQAFLEEPPLARPDMAGSGFSSRDPYGQDGRAREMLETQHQFDPIRNDLITEQTLQSMVQRDSRASQSRFNMLVGIDLAADFRTLHDLTVGLERGRNTITDVNF